MTGINFKRLTITDWKQFENIDIEFHPQLTVMTGANGSGKTTILNLLSRHFGWEHVELATPSQDKSTGFFRFFSRFFKSPNKSNELIIGELLYSNNNKTALTISDGNSPQYSVGIPQKLEIRGVSIPSHRPTYFYRNVPHISTSKRSKREAYDLAFGSSRNYYFSGGGQTSNFYLKETLMSWAISGEGNKYVVPDRELKNYFEDFQEILRKVLPPAIGFKEISIRNYEIVLITNSGDFMLDAVSGGVSAVIDLAWQVFTYTNKSDEFMTVLIDEVENHLHPEMQRSILPNFIKAFPNIQFIVSTHSPLIVGSVKNSNVYAFRYRQIDESNVFRVYNEKLDLINKAKTATDILNEVLGVPFTMPLWVEDKLNELVSKYAQQEMSENTFDNMRADLKEIGLEELMPEAMRKTLRKK
jgi:predicted ATPase